MISAVQLEVPNYRVRETIEKGKKKKKKVERAVQKIRDFGAKIKRKMEKKREKIREEKQKEAYETVAWYTEEIKEKGKEIERRGSERGEIKKRI